MDPLHKFRYSLITLIVLIGSGTAGYMAIEGWTTIEALYMTIITLSTIGFREVHSLSFEGRVFTILLIIFGAGTIAYTIGTLIQFMVEGQLRTLLGRKKVEKQISRLHSHYIVCGYGRIGRLICRDFRAKPVPFIVIEQDRELCNQMEDSGLLHVCGDATQDEVLLQAGIDKAKGLITAVTSDSANVFITLTGRELNRDMFILARASDESSELKLKRAGANKVISPYIIGASRMANAVLRPSVVDFIDIATGSENLELQIEEIKITAGSVLAGQALIDADVSKNLGIIIVGINKGNGQPIFNPGPETCMESGDILITLGKPPAIKNMELIASGQTRHG
ncbi:MAG: potassium channel protein [Desulfuromonas sp.]|nr:MAG: potassium channel protein [Desulfuromonas sp.]